MTAIATYRDFAQEYENSSQVQELKAYRSAKENLKEIYFHWIKAGAIYEEVFAADGASRIKAEKLFAKWAGQPSPKLLPDSDLFKGIQAFKDALKEPVWIACTAKTLFKAETIKRFVNGDTPDKIASELSGLPGSLAKVEYWFKKWHK